MAELVDVDAFERVGAFKEVMGCPDYAAFLTNWAMAPEWECSVRRAALSSTSVYEFNHDGKIKRLHICLQTDPPQGDMMKAYEGEAV